MKKFRIHPIIMFVIFSLFVASWSYGTYSKSETIDASSGGDTVKQAVLKNDANIDDAFTALNTQLSTTGALTDADTVRTFTTVAKTADYTLTAADCSGFKTFTNYGATGDVTFTLPSGAAGLCVDFVYCNYANDIKVAPATGNAIIVGVIPDSDYDDYPGLIVTGGAYHWNDDGMGGAGWGTTTYNSYIESTSTTDIGTHVRLFWNGTYWVVDSWEHFICNGTFVAD